MTSFDLKWPHTRVTWFQGLAIAITPCHLGHDKTNALTTVRVEIEEFGSGGGVLQVLGGATLSLGQLVRLVPRAQGRLVAPGVDHLNNTT